MNTTLSEYLLQLLAEIETELNTDSNLDIATAHHYGSKLDQLACEIIENTDYSTTTF